MSIVKLAWRNLWRNKRRTLVTISATTLAFTVMLLYSGLVEGYLAGLERNILDLDLGDLQIHANGFRDNPSLYAAIDNPEELLADLKDAGYRAAGRLIGGGLGASGEASAGVALLGIDIAADAEVSKINLHVLRGGWLDESEPKGVVIGRRLARTLEIDVGDELLLLSQGADGSIANDLFNVRGVLKGISDGIDRGTVFMTVAQFRYFFSFNGGVHQVIVRRPAKSELPAALAGAKELAPGLEVKSWRELLPTLASLLDSSRGLIMTVFFIVYLVIGILILNAMLMAVFERIREFGILKAIGAGPGLVFFVIIAESTIQAALAIVIGLALSVPGFWYLTEYGINMGLLEGTSMMGMAFDPIWRAEVTPYTYFGPLITFVIIVGAAVIYPALKAARINPIDAIRYR